MLAAHGGAPERAARTARHAALIEEMRSRIFEDGKQCYGAPGIHAELRDRGHRVSRKTVARPVKETGIRPPRRKRRMPMTTDRRHGYGIAPNLLDRNFAITAPDTVWLADIWYIPTDEGWLYLAAVKDLGTMELVGWSRSERLKGTLCEDTLKTAIRNRRSPKGLIHHSDTGVQYACDEYRKRLGLHGMTASMSRKGNCLDNAPMASFFGVLKTGMVHRTRRKARAALFEYIEIFHSRKRRHSSVGYRTPAQARTDMTVKIAA